MAVLPDGTIILAVPNFTDTKSPGVLMKISPSDEVSLFAKLPPHPTTGLVCPMGVRQAPSGDLYVADCQLSGRYSRLLRVVVRDGKPGEVKTVAQGLDIANGVAIRDGFVYLTDSAVGKTAEGDVLSVVYRFRLDEENVTVQPGGADPHCIATLKTRSKDIPVGADGIDFDENGNLYVANCGDATIEKLVLDAAGKVVSQTVLAQSPLMKSTDGLFYDRRTRRIYVADILANAIRAVVSRRQRDDRRPGRRQRRGQRPAGRPERGGRPRQRDHRGEFRSRIPRRGQHEVGEALHAIGHSVADRHRPANGRGVGIGDVPHGRGDRGGDPQAEAMTIAKRAVQRRLAATLGATTPPRPPATLGADGSHPTCARPLARSLRGGQKGP